MISEISTNLVSQRLERIYGKQTAPGILCAIEELLERYAGAIPPRGGGWSQADAMLITYADTITGRAAPLPTLHRFLRERVGTLVSFVHLLPFYPFTSDDGFSVTDFRAVRADLGTWADIEAMAEDYRIVFDGVVNHVSASSGYMEGYCSGDPRYRDFFLAIDPATDTSSVLRTRNLPLLHDYATSEGVKWLWTTFSRDQVDLNFGNPQVLVEILDVLLFYASRGASIIRLDAIPYLWKQLGTSCAHLPQTHELIKLMRDVLTAAAPHLLLLTETNVPHRDNIRYFGEGGDEAQMIYNFSLPPLIVWSLLKGDARVLSQWAAGLESVGDGATYLNITATHDGIGMRPTEGILTEPQRAELVALARERGGDVTGKRNADGSISPYELNLSYFDAINDPRADAGVEVELARYLLSQAIPMALMGIPGVYIHSLLGSRNDLEGVRRTGRARSINRQQLDLDTLSAELADPESLRARVLAGYAHLLRTRAGESAFHPGARQEVPDFGPAVFAILRTSREGDRRVLALHNVSGGSVEITLPWAGRDLLDGTGHPAGHHRLAPYQVRWIASGK